MTLTVHLDEGELFLSQKEMESMKPVSHAEGARQSGYSVKYWHEMVKARKIKITPDNKVPFTEVVRMKKKRES